MRNMPENIAQMLGSGAYFVYCFEIKNGDLAFYLTSCSKAVTIGDITYEPYSGLKLEKFIFNDSSQNRADITGIFEEGGITERDDIVGHSIRISIYFPDSGFRYLLLTYFCNRFLRYGLRFTMELEPFTNKLGQSALDHFGSKCRASFGDHRCALDKSLYPDGTNCDKSLGTCAGQFNNAINFRGEPFIPIAP
jgi:hypothetical protein